MPLSIRDFNPADVNGVNALIRGIQQAEFGMVAADYPQPELYEIEKFYQRNGGFWVAEVDNVLAGTVAVLNLGDFTAKLGRLFVLPHYRGQPLQVAKALLQRVVNWSQQKGIKKICLETVVEPCAAQAFWLRHGFEEIEQAQMPSVYPLSKYPSRYFVFEVIRQ